MNLVALRRNLAGVLAGLAIAASAAFAAFTWHYAKTHPVRDPVYVDKWGEIRGRVISATVTTFHSQNRLVVKELTGSVRVKATKKIWMLTGVQELSVPASVTYFVDLKGVGAQDVNFDPYGKVVFVRLPPVQISAVTLNMEKATQVNGGLLTMNDDVRQELSKLNYKNATGAFLKLANERSRLDAARVQAQNNVSALLEIPLKATGSGEITVRAY